MELEFKLIVLAAVVLWHNQRMLNFCCTVSRVARYIDKINLNTLILYSDFDPSTFLHVWPAVIWYYTPISVFSYPFNWSMPTSLNQIFVLPLLLLSMKLFHVIIVSLFNLLEVLNILNMGICAILADSLGKTMKPKCTIFLYDTNLLLKCNNENISKNLICFNQHIAPGSYLVLTENVPK